MKILAIADRKPKESIEKLVRENKVELICTLGDLEYFDLLDLKKILDIPKIGVYGNHCSGKYFEELGIENMHLQTRKFGGLMFGGFEGSIRYKESVYAKMYSQEESQAMLKDFSRVDVMLAHCPPFGVNDEPDDPTHAGFVGLREYVERMKPNYLLHGHTYPATSNNFVDRLGETEIIYVFGEKIIEIRG